MPARLQDLLPSDHLACRVWELVEQLDLSEFYTGIVVEEGTQGAPATDPKILVAVWIYATTQGETSARQIETLCVEHLAYIWLCGGVTMNYHTLSDFRVNHGEALNRLFTQIVQPACAGRRLAKAELVAFEAHAQDGMRVRASAACLRASACACTHADRYTHRQGAASFHRQATLEKALARVTAEQETLRQSETGETSPRTARERAAQERATSERIARLEAALAELPCLWQTGCRASCQAGG